jgi:alpha-tubulin suppressor-like RCC1 family protein
LGQLGDGTTVDKSLPVQVTALGNDVAQVSAGDQFTCARKTDGTVWCWGENGGLSLGDGTNIQRSSPVQVKALGSAATAISSGGGHTCARKKDGTLWCWGHNGSGELGDGTKVGASSEPVQVTALGASVATVTSGEQHTCAIKTDKTAWCWGSSQYGQLGNGTNDSNTPVQVGVLGASVAEVSAGYRNTCARKLDGSAWCWGDNSKGQLGYTTGNPYSASPSEVTLLGSEVAEVSAGALRTCARKKDGTLWCWGSNFDGALGDGSAQDQSAPVKLGVLGTLAAEVSPGFVHACARESDGTLWCWGANEKNQLGDGTMMMHISPEPVTALFECQ